jgi:hypothetical protein
MFERAPNGFFVRGMMVFNHLRRGGYVSKGFIFEAPDLTNSPVADLNDFQDQLCLLLKSLNENQRLQVHYFSDSDYPLNALVEDQLVRLRLALDSTPARAWLDAHRCGKPLTTKLRQGQRSLAEK